MSRLAIVVPVCGHLEETKAAWGCLVEMTGDKAGVPLVVVDNASPDDTVAWIERYVFPHFPDHCLIRNPENGGIARACNQGWRAAAADLYAFLHNDLFISHPRWNRAVEWEMGLRRQIGLLGFCGARGAERDGGRSGVMSNLLEADRHGDRVAGLKDCVLLDGLAMVARRQMLEAAGGFDESFGYFFYDKDLSMASLAAGYTNAVLGVWCHHKAATTATGLALPDHDAARDRYLAKWGHLLPRRR